MHLLVCVCTCVCVHVCIHISLFSWIGFLVSVRKNLTEKPTNKLQTCWEMVSVGSEWRGLTGGPIQRPVLPGCH